MADGAALGFRIELVKTDLPAHADRSRVIASCPECTAQVQFENLIRHLMDCLGIEPGSRLLVGPLIVNVTGPDYGTVWLADGLEYDRAAFRLKVGGAVIDLTKKYALLLDYFLTNAGIVLSRDRILQAVWGHDHVGNDRLVDTYVARLRRTLVQHPDGYRLITTVPGVGYRFDLVKER